MSFLPTLKHGTSVLLARLLRTDIPVPERTELELEAEQQRNYRWNFMVNTLDTTSWFFGASLISASTIIPLFISKLTSSTVPIGVAAMIAMGSWHLPQLFTANFIERVARKKPIIVNLGLFLERLPIFVMIGAAALAVRSTTLALILFLVSYAWHSFGAGTLSPAWQEMIARCFPVQRRGRFLGTGIFLGTVAGIGGAALSTRLLSNIQFPQNFMLVFALSATAILVSWFFISLTREPVKIHRTPRRSQREFLLGVREILKKYHNYRRFLITRLLFSFGAMGSGFITLAAIRTWDVSDATVGIYTAMMLVGQALGTLSLGLMADRKGHKQTFEIVALASLLAFSLVWLGTSPAYFYPAFFLLGIANGGLIVSGILLTMEFADPERRPTFVGITSFGIGIAGMIAPLLGTALSTVSFSLIFAIGVFINLIAFFGMRFWVKEPRFARAY
jgi:MFS family permease